jgi:hypothetical protein
MKKFILSILSIAISITVLVGEDKVPEFDGCYEYNTPYIFRGTVVKKVYHDNETGKHHYLALELDNPICTLQKEYATRESEIMHMQISSGGNNMIQKLEGKYVELKGSLYHSDNAHHFTKVLISLNSIENRSKPEKISNSDTETYYAKISQRDHYGARKQKLKDAVTILQQDRANYHKYHKREQGDTGDSYFYKRSNRDKMGRMLTRGSTSQNTLDAIRHGTPLVKVEIYRDHIDVTLESEDGQSRQRQQRRTLTQRTVVPVMIGGEQHDIDACGGTIGVVRGISRRGDGFLAVRSGPGTKYKTIDKFYRNGERVIICDRKGEWIGIVYGKNCGTESPIPQRKPYDGSCKSGWAFEKYVRFDNSLQHKTRNQKNLKKPEQGSGSLTSSEKRSLIKQLLSAPDRQIKSYVKVSIRDFLEKGDHFDPIHKSYETYKHTCTQIYPNKFKCKFGAYSNFKDTGDEAATVVKYDAVKKNEIVKIEKIYPVFMAD